MDYLAKDGKKSDDRDAAGGKSRRAGGKNMRKDTLGTITHTEIYALALRALDLRSSNGTNDCTGQPGAEAIVKA